LCYPCYALSVLQVYIAYSKGLFHSPEAATTTLSTASIGDESIMKAPTKAVADSAGVEDTGGGGGGGIPGNDTKTTDSDVNSKAIDPAADTNTNTNTNAASDLSRSKATPLSPDNVPINTNTTTHGGNQDFTLSPRAIHTFNSNTSNTNNINSTNNTNNTNNLDNTSAPSTAVHDNAVTNTSTATNASTAGSAGGTSGGVLSGLASAPLGEYFVLIIYK